MGADKIRFGSAWEDFEHAYLMDRKNRYPKNIHECYTLLKGWKKSSNKQTPLRVGVSFNTVGDENGDSGTALVNAGKGKYTGPPCSRCGRNNHPVERCIAKKHSDGTLLHVEGHPPDDHNEEVSGKSHNTCYHDVHELMFVQPAHTTRPMSQKLSSRGSIPRTWILIDSQSTIDVFSNGELLSKIKQADTTMHIRCNAGAKSTNQMGYLSGYGWVWYFPDGIANILSLSRVKDKYRVTFDSASDNCFHVHKPGQILKFQEAIHRLYYIDVKQRNEESNVLITTVDENKTQFLAFDFNKAKLARSIQCRIGRPKTQDYIRYVRHNLIPNCPITVQDIKNAEAIWGPDLGSLKGKTAWKQPTGVRIKSHPIPLQIMQQYKDVTQSADIMKVNGIPFLMTISKHIKFGSAGKLDSMANALILKHFWLVIGVYATRGFRVSIIMADNQFESMRGELADMGALINVVSRDEHVPEIERYNRTIKERVRSAYNMLPFKFVPPVFIIELVYAQVFWRNMFALAGSISSTQSPSELVLNRKLDFNAHCKVEFGEYVQTHEEHDNSMSAHTVGAIAT